MKARWFRKTQVRPQLARRTPGEQLPTFFVSVRNVLPLPPDIHIDWNLFDLEPLAFLSLRHFPPRSPWRAERVPFSSLLSVSRYG